MHSTVSLTSGLQVSSIVRRQSLHSLPSQPSHQTSVILDALVPKVISFSSILSYTTDSIRPLTMGNQSTEEKQTNKGRKLDRLLSTSGLVLSVACCIAIIHVKLRLREHHHLISHFGTFFNEMEAEIRRKVQENSENGRWQVGRNSHLEGEAK